MLIRDLTDCREIIAGDRSVLRDLLNPRRGVRERNPELPETAGTAPPLGTAPGFPRPPLRGKSGAVPRLKLRYSLAHATVLPGRKSVPHRLRTSEVYYILSGRGVMHINDERARVAPGQAIYIPPNARQFITATGHTPLRFLCIVDPAWRKQDEQVEGTKSRVQNPKSKQSPKSK